MNENEDNSAAEDEEDEDHGEDDVSLIIFCTESYVNLTQKTCSKTGRKRWRRRRDLVRHPGSGARGFRAVCGLRRHVLGAGRELA